MTTTDQLRHLLYEGEINLNLLLRETGIDKDTFLLKLDEKQFNDDELKVIRRVIRERK